MDLGTVQMRLESDVSKPYAEKHYQFAEEFAYDVRFAPSAQPGSSENVMLLLSLGPSRLEERIHLQRASPRSVQGGKAALRDL